MQWASEQGVLPPHQSFIGISLDNPAVVEGDHCRHDACVTIPKSFDKNQHADMQFKRVDGGLYAVYSFYDPPQNLNHAYSLMYEHWLPSSGYQADYERYNLEFTMNNPLEDSEHKLKVDLYIPIKK